VPAEAEAQVELDLPAHVEAIRVREAALVAAAGAVHDHQLGALRDRLPMHGHVARRGAPLVLGGRVEAQHLLDGVRDHGGLLHQDALFAGEAVEPVEGRREELRDRLVPGGGEQVEEAPDLDVGEPFTVDLGLEEHAHHVVAGALAARSHLLGEVGMEPAHRFDALPRRHRIARVAVQQVVRPAAHAVPVFLRDAEQGADHVHRQLCRELAHHVEARASHQTIEVLHRDLADARLEGADAARREGLRDEVPVTRLLGRIHEDHQRAREARVAHQLEHRPLRRGERLPVEQCVVAVGEAGHRPEIEPRVVVRRRLVPHAPVQRVGVDVDLVGVGVVLEVHFSHRNAGSTRFPTSSRCSHARAGGRPPQSGWSSSTPRSRTWATASSGVKMR
jgi:hypothetical protein